MNLCSLGPWIEIFHPKAMIINNISSTRNTPASTTITTKMICKLIGVSCYRLLNPPHSDWLASQPPPPFQPRGVPRRSSYGCSSVSKPCGKQNRALETEMKGCQDFALEIIH
jgi:hypothetical protein